MSDRPFRERRTSVVLIVCVDVDYRDEIAVAAGVWFRGWPAREAETEAVTTCREIAPYQPGEFYRRELPCLLAVLARGPAADVIVVDGYVWLGPERAGLGAHLHAALGGRTAVVGVAKSRFAGATDAVPVYRGGSRSPLYVTAAGAGAEEAAGWVASMDGPYRVPSLLKRVDRLARTSDP
jgi:deoxyribonuclease V